MYVHVARPNRVYSDSFTPFFVRPHHYIGMYIHVHVHVHVYASVTHVQVHVHAPYSG